MFKSIKKAVGQVWSPIATTLQVAETSAILVEDTVSTYGNEVLISNATVRNEQLKALEGLDRVVTNDQISLVLTGKQISDTELQAAS